MLAVFKGQDELFDELIAAGADPQRGGNWTPLHYAATEGRTEFIERLLKAGASANIQTSSGVTPLIMAARKPSRAAVTMLFTVPQDRKSTRLNSSHKHRTRMPSSA